MAILLRRGLLSARTTLRPDSADQVPEANRGDRIRAAAQNIDSAIFIKGDAGERGFVDTPVQENSIPFPTGVKIQKRVIERYRKIAQKEASPSTEAGKTYPVGFANIRSYE